MSENKHINFEEIASQNHQETNFHIPQSGRLDSELGTVSKLGNQNTKYVFDYDPNLLETFDNKHPENDYFVTFDAYEVTTLCAKTFQPDFCKLYINYVPNKKMVESKSLKLYLFSFRNHGDFHEDFINMVVNDLYELMEPKYIEAYGLFTPRGGISIYPFVSKVNPEFANDYYTQVEMQRKLDFLSHQHEFRKIAIG